MQQSIDENEFKLIRDYIAEVSGVVIPPEKSYLIETKLFKLVLDYGTESFDEFYYEIISRNDQEITQKIIDSITVNETFWFRDAVLWKCFEQEILPRYVDELITGKKSKIRIWSAAVSTGQEAYSIAMCIDNYLKRNNITSVSLSDFDIFATDISNRVLDIARSGRYDRISISRGLSEHYKANYFKNDGSAWDLDPDIRSAVRFRRFNLKDTYKGFGKFDAIFCRYVLIYFSSTLKNDIAFRMNNSLVNGGVFLTGHYVLYDMLKEIYDVNNYGNLTYYTKKTANKDGD